MSRLASMTSFARLLSFPEANESRIPQMPVWCPFQKLELPDQQWF